MFQNSLLRQLLLQAALIAVNAVFAGAEIALISVNPVKLEKLSSGGNRRAKRLLALTQRPAKFLATIQVGITLAGFLGSAFAAENFSGKLSAALLKTGLAFQAETIGRISLVLTTLALSFFTLVLGELVPKRIAMRRAEKLAFALVSLISIISRIFAPLVWLLTRSTNLLLRLFGIDPEAEETAVTEEEIRLLVDAGSRRGSINTGEKEIIHNVFEFNDKTAEEVMTHRRDVVFLWLKNDDQSWERTVLETRWNFYPVCGGDVDDIAGILSARDYLALNGRSRAAALEKALRPADFVPSTARADVLFRKMKAGGNHFAVVVDEYGGMDGIVTMNDLLRELVGNLTGGERKQEAPPIEKKGPGLWRISGAASLDRVSRETGFLLRQGNYDTFGGFVFTLLGRLPEDGEKCELTVPADTPEGGLLKISIAEVKDRRLESAMVRLLPAPGKDPQGDAGREEGS
ncbi:MAG: hemolysin family protein [Treponema sp.]|jgi:putative hemolysin|nr:hemolysin family protein [Treponema sp.]